MTNPAAGEPLASELATLLARVDAMPPQMISDGSAILEWRNLDARLAVLVGEQADADAVAAGVRGAPSRLLTFACDGVTIDLGVSVEDGRVRLIGQLSVLDTADVEVRHRAGVWAGQTDTLGRFSVGDLPPGPMRVCCTPLGPETAVCTAMFQA